MSNNNLSPCALLDREIRELHERAASVGAKAVEYCQSERDLNLILEAGSMAMWTTDADLRLQTCRGAYAAVLGRDIAQGAVLTDVLGADDLVVAAGKTALSGSETQATLTRGGNVFSLVVCPINETGGTVSVAIDNTQLHRRGQEIAARERRFRDLFENAEELIFTTGANGTLTSVNQAIERILGYSVAEVLTTRLQDLLTEDSRIAFDYHLDALRQSTWTNVELVALSKNGARVFLEMSIRLVEQAEQSSVVEGIARDVSRRRVLEDQVRQVQKMEAIGVLAGGIAHDFNNLLTGILGYAYLIQAEENVDSRIAEAVDVIVKSAERAAQLTTQLVSFARRSKDQNVPVSVHDTIRDLVEVLGRTIDKRIRVETNLAPSSPHVMGDAAQIYQALLNLSLNGRDAITGDGKLTISTRINEATVVITVADSGHGIPPPIRDRIFEPFFTTKPQGKGTGMGLAMVYGIARNHGGSIQVETEVGKGSAFDITLPLCASTVRACGAATKAAERTARRILVIDDEEVVRQVLSRMLKGLGYDVVAEADSNRAVEYYRAHPDLVDAVIVDMMMPGLTGRDVYYALRSVNPEVRVVLSSGFSRDDDAQELVKETGIQFLPKPYHIEQLSAALTTTLARPMHAVL